MPDLKTELMKIQPLTSLNFDDEGENTVEVVSAPTTETTETSVTRQIWEFVKLHPGCSVKEIARDVPSVDAAGISTRLNQLMRRGMITRSINPVTGKHINHAAAAEFVSMSREDRMVRMKEGRAAWVKQQAVKKARRDAKAEAKKNAPAPIAPPVVAPAQIPTDMSDVDVFVSRLTVADARNLYDALKRVFFS